MLPQIFLKFFITYSWSQHKTWIRLPLKKKIGKIVQAISLERKMLMIFRVDQIHFGNPIILPQILSPFPQPEQKKLSHLHGNPWLPSVRVLQIPVITLTALRGSKLRVVKPWKINGTDHWTRTLSLRIEAAAIAAAAEEGDLHTSWAANQSRAVDDGDDAYYCHHYYHHYCMIIMIMIIVISMIISMMMRMMLLMMIIMIMMLGSDPFLEHQYNSCHPKSPGQLQKQYLPQQPLHMVVLEADWRARLARASNGGSCAMIFFPKGVGIFQIWMAKLPFPNKSCWF